MAISKDNRGYVAGKYGIELDGVKAGWVSEVDGGHATADVVVEKFGSDHLHHKHLGNVKYEEVTFKCGTGMSKALYTWIDASFRHAHGKEGRKNGAMVFADYDSNEISRLTFREALITEVGMPALDAASKDAAKMTIKFKPELTRKEIRGGGSIAGGSAFPVDAKKQKKWLPSNFRLTIGDLDCTKVNKIEALTIKQKVTENAIGHERDYQQEPASVEVPNLVITLAESHAESFYKWHEEMVIKGKHDLEKDGTLVYLTPDLQTELFTLNFSNLGVFKVAPDKMEAGAEGIRRVKIEMYCEDIRFNFSPAATMA